MNKPKFKKFAQTTDSFVDAEGFWNVKVTLTERDSVDGETWREETISAMSIDRDFDSAQLTSLRSVMQWLEEYVYSKGFNSMTDAVEHFKSLEAANEQEPNNNVPPAS